MNVKAYATDRVAKLFIKNELPGILETYYKAKAVEDLKESDPYELAKEYANEISDELDTYRWPSQKFYNWGEAEKILKTNIEEELNLDVIFEEDYHYRSGNVDLGEELMDVYFWAANASLQWKHNRAYPLELAICIWLKELKA